MKNHFKAQYLLYFFHLFCEIIKVLKITNLHFRTKTKKIIHGNNLRFSLQHDETKVSFVMTL